MFGYKWKMNDSTSVDSNQPQRTLREEIEYQMQQMEERERQQCLQPKEPEPDYSKMTLREELETRFKLLEERDRQQKLAQSEPRTFSAQPVQNTAAQPQSVQQAQPAMQVQTTAAQPQQIAQSPTANSSNNDWMAEYARRFAENVERAGNTIQNIKARIPQPEDIPVELVKALFGITDYKLFSKDIGSVIQKYGEPSVQKLLEYQHRLTPLEMSDVNKHQYISCVGAQGGYKSLLETLGGGVFKEREDWKKKIKNPQKYGGIEAIKQDCLKDLKNDLIGAMYGYLNINPDACEELLPEEFRKNS